MAADIHQSTISMESAAPKRSSPSRKRRKILRTCTVSILATADRASSKASTLHGPVGFLVNRVIQLITTKGPFAGLYRFQTYLILAIMSFLDDRILKVENVVEHHFPSSSYVFDKIDDVICFTESLPTKLDEVVDKLSWAVKKFPVRNCIWRILDLVILLRSVLATWWGSDFTLTKERDIMVDTNCSENSQMRTKRVVCDEAVCQIEPPMTLISHTTSLPDKNTMDDKHDDIKEESSDRIGDGNEARKKAEEHVLKCSYKEVLEKGNSFKEVLERGNSYKQVLKKGNIFKEAVEKGSSYKEVLEKGTKDELKEQNDEYAKEDNNSKGDLKSVDGGNDPILELFESAWHMT